jgi:hypothetical protein
MPDPNLAQLTAVARMLRPLLDELVFVGGCVTGLLITDPAAPAIRSTIDVDAVAEITSYAEYVAFSGRLRGLGFSEDASEGAPVCRWVSGPLILDVMPLDEKVLGFSNRWYAAALRNPALVSLEPSLTIRAITAPLFLAAKLEAFRSRGGGDYFGSHDLEDVLAVVDGRPSLLEEVRSAPDELRAYLASEWRALLRDQRFTGAIPGHLPPDTSSQARVPLVLSRLETLSRS